METPEENRKLVVTGRINLLHFAAVFEALSREQREGEKPLTRSDALDQCVAVVFDLLEKKGLARTPGSFAEAAAMLEIRKALPPKHSDNRKPLERLLESEDAEKREDEELDSIMEAALTRAESWHTKEKGPDILHGEKGLDIIPEGQRVLREKDLDDE